VGTPILPRTVALNRRLEGALSEIDHLFDNPSTLLSLRKLRTALSVTRPAIEFIAPYQTVCNYFVYFFNSLGEAQSQTVPGGTNLNQGVKLVNILQPNSLGSTVSSRPWDVPPGKDPRGAKDALGLPLGRIYSPPYQPAIDAQGNADCQNGQDGWVRGPLGGTRYGPGFVPGTRIPTGGNFPILLSDFPILSGGTYKARELGIKNLRDVP
jgi:hypothetical protein